jgi:hypothetical protein
MPNPRKRPGDYSQSAKLVVDIATGESRIGLLRLRSGSNTPRISCARVAMATFCF